MKKAEYNEKKARFKNEASAFLIRNRERIHVNSKRLCHFFELACYCRVIRFYIQLGFSLEIIPPRNTFRFKATTRGSPNKYSFFRVSRGDLVYDIRSNMPVVSISNDGEYVPDIVISHRDNNPQIERIENRDLMSFCEVKYLKSHPEMLANFIGIVFELTPEYICGPAPNPILCIHPAPTLIVSGYSSGNVESIRNGMMDRYLVNFSLNCEENIPELNLVHMVPDREND